MGDAIRWLFTFSSPQHFAWFLVSMAILSVSAICAAAKKRPFPWFAACFHASTAVQAAVILALGYVGPTYSVHCIWFNALMACAHLGLLKIASRGRKFAPRSWLEPR